MEHFHTYWSAFVQRVIAEWHEKSARVIQIKNSQFLVFTLLIVTLIEYLFINKSFRMDEFYGLKPVKPSKSKKKSSPKKKGNRGKKGKNKPPRDKSSTSTEDEIDAFLKEEYVAAYGSQNGMSQQKINTYALYKCYGMILTIIDHLGWCYVVSDRTVNSYTRAIGRGAAPVFFFLVGYSGVYKFRWRLWRWCLYIFISEAIFELGLVEKTWESMSTFLVWNLILKYAAPYLIKYPVIHVGLWLINYKFNDAINVYIPYGGFAFNCILSGFVMRSQNRLFGQALIGLTMSAKVVYFSQQKRISATYYGQVATIMCLINMVCMCFFKIKPIIIKQQWLRNIILFMNENAYQIYHGHMIYFYVLVRKWYMRG